VLHLPNETADLTLRFEVRARVFLEGSKTAVKFETALDTSRRLTIR
jgi:predicted component of type VI protein secretion system